MRSYKEDDERHPTMQNSISFSIESIISRTDPPKQREDERKVAFSCGPLSAMQNLVELTPRGDYYLEEAFPCSNLARKKSNKHFHGEDLMDHSSSSPSGKPTINFIYRTYTVFKAIKGV